jgi:hypothetical protein
MTAIFYNQEEQTPLNPRPIAVASHHAGDQIITHKADPYSFKFTQHFCIQLMYSVDIATKWFQSHRTHVFQIVLVPHHPNPTPPPPPPPQRIFLLFNFVRFVNKQAITSQMFLCEFLLNFLQLYVQIFAIASFFYSLE